MFEIPWPNSGFSPSLPYCPQMYNMMPWVMRRVPGPHRRIFTGWEEVTSFINIRIQEHMKDNDPSSPRDFIDCFLNEIEKVTMIMTMIISDVVVKKSS